MGVLRHAKEVQLISESVLFERLRRIVKNELAGSRYKVQGRRSFVRKLDDVEAVIQIDGSKQGGGPYHIMWGIVVPVLVPPLWKVRYSAGQPGLGCMFGGPINLSALPDSYRVFVGDELSDQDGAAIIAAQVGASMERMKDVASVDGLLEEIVQSDSDSYFFPFENWKNTVAKALQILQNPDLAKGYSENQEWLNMSPRAQRVIDETVAIATSRAAGDPQ